MDAQDPNSGGHRCTGALTSLPSSSTKGFQAEENDSGHSGNCSLSVSEGLFYLKALVYSMSFIVFVKVLKELIKSSLRAYFRKQCQNYHWTEICRTKLLFICYSSLFFFLSTSLINGQEAMPTGV